MSCVAMSAADPKPSFVERLFAEHRAALQTFFQRRIRSKSDAPDLAQEVYVRMLRISDQTAIRNPVHYLYARLPCIWGYRRRWPRSTWPRRSVIADAAWRG
jgi:DNA-directed RNA polymerase specialized sigma24 family protein